MSYVITLAGYIPGARYDSEPWTQAQIAYAATLAGPFTPFDTLTFPDPDPDPTAPATRNLTTVLSPAPAGYFKVTFLDADGNQEPTDPVAFPPAPATSVLTLAQVRDRLETDLSDATLQALIDGAEQEIVARYGPYRSDDPITVAMLARFRRLALPRPIDLTESIQVVESVGSVDVTLYADDYRVWGARFLERRHDGPNPPRCGPRWAPRVTVTYTPEDDTVRRSEVALKLVQLSTEYQGVLERSVGDTRTTLGLRSASGGGSPLVYVDERERLLETLGPRGGVLLR